MKIVEEKGQKLVVFEAQDAELQIQFERGLEALDVLLRAALAAEEVYEQAKEAFRLARTKLEVYRLEHNDAIWGGVKAAVAKLLGVDEAPLMQVKGVGSKQISIKDESLNDTNLHELLRQFLQQKAMGKDEHKHECGDCPGREECDLPAAVRWRNARVGDDN